MRAIWAKLPLQITTHQKEQTKDNGVALEAHFCPDRILVTHLLPRFFAQQIPECLLGHQELGPGGRNTLQEAEGTESAFSLGRQLITDSPSHEGD